MSATIKSTRTERRAESRAETGGIAASPWQGFTLGRRADRIDVRGFIHYMHDNKYAYERLEMALHDYSVLRTMACGIAGLSVTADSLAAIKYATVRPVRDDTGLVVHYRTDGEFPTYGNDDDRADDIAVWLVRTFMDKVRQYET